MTKKNLVSISNTYLDYKPRRIGQAATREHESASSPMSIRCIDSVSMRVITVLAHIKRLSLVKARSYGPSHAYNHPKSLDLACPSLQVQFLYATTIQT